MRRDRAISIGRAAWQMVKIFYRTRRLVKKERRYPLEDRRPFIVRCALNGKMSVSYFSSLVDYRREFETAHDEPFVTWCTGYDPYQDVNR